MKKVIIIYFLVFSFLFSFEIKELKSINEIKENNNAFLLFSTSYCPWCFKQKRVLEEIEVQKDNLQMFYINDSSKVFKELIKKYPFSVKYYPTSFIVVKEDGVLDILYEFQGFQKKSNILEVLNDEDSF